MADLTVTAGNVAPVFVGDARIRAMKLAEAVTAGQTAYRTAAGLGGISGSAAAGKQEFVGIFLTSGPAGGVVNVLEEGEIFGFDLSALSADVMIYQSDTLGALGTTAGTKTVCVGRVTVLTDEGVQTKVLRIYALQALKH